MSQSPYFRETAPRAGHVRMEGEKTRKWVDYSSIRRCQYSDGLYKCRAFAIKESDLCFRHDPKWKEPMHKRRVNEWKERTNKLQEENERLRTEIRCIDEEHMEEVERLKEGHNAEIRRLNEEHNAEIRCLNEKHNAEVYSLILNLQATLLRLQQAEYYLSLTYPYV